MGRILIEWRLDDGRLGAFSTDLYVERGSFFRCFSRDVARADRDAEGGTHRAAADDAARLPSHKHCIAMTRDVFVSHREADELLFHTVRFLLVEHRTTD